MEVHPTVITNQYTRKRQRKPEKWKKNLAKEKRYSPKGLPTRVCTHNTKALKCSHLTMNDIKRVHENFYKKKNKKDQDIILLKSCSAQPSQDRKGSKGKKQFTTKYSLSVAKKKIPVCQKFFLSIYGITKHRVLYVTKKYFESGEFPNEARGGDRLSRKYADKKQSIHTFIQSLKCLESHYCRKNKISERKYLSPELNIAKLYKMYTASAQAIPGVKQSYFRNIFNTQYNLGFGAPATDACSKCLELNERIKNEGDAKIKALLMTEKRVHKLKSNAFYGMLKETKIGMKIISFDCQKNLPMPKVPDQSCYYSRQLYQYNFTMFEGQSNASMEKNQIFAYHCTENEFHKDSNLIASAVYHRLSETDKIGIHTIRLVADGCGGQNKNSILVGTLCKWLSLNPDIKNIELVFPVTGHSFMPPDRVFGVIEKKMKNKDTMVLPQEVIDVIGETSTLIKFGTECPVYNWRDAVKNVVKPTTSWNLKFKECKRFIFKRSKQTGHVHVRGELMYKSDLGAFFNICRPQNTIEMIVPELLPNIVAVNKLKLQDIDKLITKHFGAQWKEQHNLAFYKDLLVSQQALVEGEQQDSQTAYCNEVIHESQELRV